VSALLTAAAATVAFQLIFIQPAITTFLLPSTGGHPYLWHGAQVVFLLLLTSGYWLAGRVGGWMSLRVLGASLILLALLTAIPPSWIPVQPSSIGSAILFLFLATGPGFLALAIGSVGTQITFVRLFENRDPYWLYAASNAGSLLAAWSYVFLVEPNVDLSAQIAFWKTLTAIIFLSVGMVFIARNGRAAPRGPVPDPAAPGLRLRWIAAGLCPVALSLAATSYLTLHFGAQPTIWLAPFAAYLTTLAMAFTSAGSRVLERVARLAPIATVVAVLVLIAPPNTSIWLFVTHVTLISILMSAWNLRLASMRPPPALLSSFYVHASLGGFAAAVLISMAAPLLLNPAHFSDTVIRDLRAVLITGAPEYLLFLLAGVALPARISTRLLMGIAATVVAVVSMLRADASSLVLHWSRTEFGQLVVTESPGNRMITNGIVTHGYQATRCASRADPLTCVEPTAYYGKLGPVGAAAATVRESTSTLRMGVVGLGAGRWARTARTETALRSMSSIRASSPSRSSISVSSSAPARTARACRYRWATAAFWRCSRRRTRWTSWSWTHFRRTPCPHISLRRRGLLGFTRLLAGDGAIAIHVSNRFFNLVPVVGAGIRAAGLTAIAGIDPGAPNRFSSTWVIASRNQAVIDRVGEKLRKAAIGVQASLGDVKPWTDERHSLLSALKK
jgi:hypothetical protein